MDIFRKEKLERAILISAIMAFPQSSLKEEFRGKARDFWESQIGIDKSIDLRGITIDKNRLMELIRDLSLLIDLEPQTKLFLD